MPRYPEPSVVSAPAACACLLTAVGRGDLAQLDDAQRAVVLLRRGGGTACPAEDLAGRGDRRLAHQQPRAAEHAQRGHRPTVEQMRDRRFQIPYPDGVREQGMPSEVP